jgi:hypothetical protein
MNLTRVIIIDICPVHYLLLVVQEIGCLVMEILSRVG